METQGKIVVISLLVAVALICGCAHVKPKPSFDEEAAEESYYHFSLADQAILRGDLEEAIYELKQAIEYDPESATLRVHLASLYLAKGNTAYARTLLEEALGYDPNHIVAHKVLGGLCLAEGKLECAESHYRAILDIEPGNRHAVKYLVFALNQQGRLDEALDVLEKYISAEPDDLNAQFELVEIYLGLGKSAKALDVLNNIISARPRNTIAILARAALLEDMGRLDEAKEDYLQAVALDPQNTETHEQLIRLCLDLHDFKCAETQLDELKRCGADAATIDLHEGLYLFSTREFGGAAKKFERLHEQNPEDHYMTLLWGLALKNERDLQQAEEALKSIPAESPQRFDALLALAEICTSKADPCALEYADKAKELKPQSYQPYLLEGDFYIRLDDYENAELALEKAEQMAADSQDLLYSLGVYYDRMGMWEKGLERVQRILDENPKDPDALNFIGYTYADHGIKLDEAERLLSQAIQIRPNDGFIADSLGWCYFKQGRYNEAKKLLERAAELTPFEPTIWEHLGDLYTALGNRRRAKEMFLKALELKPEAKQKSKIEKRLEKLAK